MLGAAYVAASAVAGLLGHGAPVAVYVLVAWLAAIACLRLPRSFTGSDHAPLAVGYRGAAVAALLFGVARLLTLSDTSSVTAASDILFSLAYLPLVLGVVIVVVKRGRVELESLIEAAMVGIGVGTVINYGWAVVDVGGGVNHGFVAGASLLLFVVSVGHLGRRTRSSLSKSWFIACVLAAVVELSFSLADVSDLAQFISVNFASSPFLPIIWGLISARDGDGPAVGEIPVRREFRTRQLMGSAVLLILPLGCLAHSFATGDAQPEREILLAAAVVNAVLAVSRMQLLIAARDEDHRREVLLRQMADRFVETSIGEDPMDDATLALVAELFRGEIRYVAVLDDVHAEISVVQSVVVGPASGLTGRPTSLSGAEDLDGSRLAELGLPMEVTHALATPLRSAPNQVVVIASSRRLNADLLPYLRSVAAQLDLVFTAQRLRELNYQRRSNDRFRALVQDSNDIVALVGASTLRVEFVSPTLHRLLGVAERGRLGRSPFARMHPDDRAAMERRLEQARDEIVIDPIDVRIQHADGRYRWFSLSVRDLSTEPEVSGLLFNYADVHDRKMVELQMAAAEIQYRTLVTNSNDVMVLLDEGVITYLTPNVERVFGFSSADLIGARASTFLDDRADAAVERLFDDDGGLIASGTETVVQLPTASGGSSVGALTFLDPGLPGREVMVTVRDVTEQRRLEASLREQALHDPLTGLFNRASVYPELQRSLQGLDRGMHLGVLHLDVHDFKSINDSLGFAAGDNLLIDIATRLRTVLRRTDTLARFSGDEFAVVTLGSSADHVAQLIDRLKAAFDSPFDIGGRSVPITVVIGAVTTQDRTENATRLLESAGIALQHAKAIGRDIAIFEETMREAASERFELASGLLPGIGRDEFFVVYQPLLNLDSQVVTSTEALLRWNHPERGFVSPATFIPLAEQSGAIIELGRWVLRKACEQLADWHERLPDGRGLSMSVNVSARQLEHPDEAQRLLRIIHETGVDTASLILELTESVMLEDTERLRAMLEEYRKLGIRIAVDDFGTGAAGLNHLRDVPFDIVKIDKSYVDGLGESDDAHMLITGVIELAHGLNAKTVAEGIETPQQAALLRSMRCNYGQGFYLGRPMEQTQIEEWFAQGRAGSAAASIARPGGGRRRGE
ncbi:MAG: EAL domain-containing protein [Acidimicrobiales bacterium]